MENKEKKYTFIKRETLTNIAKAIRSGKGTEDKISPTIFANEILSIVDIFRTIVDGSFRGDLVIPEGANSIKPYIFRTSSFKSVTIPDSVKSLQYQAFRDCASLKSVTLGSGLTSINDEVFFGCRNCLVFDFSTCGQVPSLSAANSFYDINADCKIIVPTNLYSRWIITQNWSNWTKNIVSIGKVKTSTVTIDDVWIDGQDVGGYVPNTGYVSAYCQKEGGNAISIDAVGNNTYKLSLYISPYEGGYDYKIAGNPTFTEPGTYEIWVENGSGTKVYRRILEVSQ